MDIVDLILRVMGFLGPAATVYLLLQKAPLDRRASKIQAAGDLFDEYNKVIERLKLRDDKFAELEEEDRAKARQIRQYIIDSDRDKTEILRLQQVNLEQSKTVDNLVKAVNGMPTVIAQMMRQTVTDNTFIDLLQKKLVGAGVALVDQPTEEPKESMKELDKEAKESVKKAVELDKKEDV